MLFTLYEWTSAEQHQAVFKIRSEHHYDGDIAQVSGGFCKFQSTGLDPSLKKIFQKLHCQIECISVGPQGN